VTSPDEPYRFPPAPRLRVYTLGRFVVEVDGEPLRFSARTKRKPLELLKVLVALGGSEAAVARLAEALWPDADGDRAYGAFSITLNRTRKLVGRDALVLRGARLSLDPQQCWVDVLAFGDWLEQASRHAGERAAAAAWEALEQALALYRGAFLEGEFDLPEILSAREKWHGLFLRHVKRFGEFFAEAGEPGRAIELYQRGIEVDDLAEELYQRLMGCLAKAGRLAEALAVYQRCHETLRAAFAVEPAPETRAVHEALLAEQARQAAASTPPAPAAAPEAPRTDPAAREAAERQGERRRVTIVFSDLTGYTRLVEAVDPEQVERIMARIKAEAERVVEAHGGIVNQIVGDEVMALFGIPAAHEDDPRQAVQAALALHAAVRELDPEGMAGAEFPLCLHTGISTGTVVARRRDDHEGRYSTTGSPVNIGARLGARARPDEILISRETHRLVAPYFETEPLEPATVNGLAQPLAAFRVAGRSRVETRFDAAAMAGFTPFAGREAELATLWACLERASAGQGQFVTVEGEAGIGKSRLFHEFGRRLAGEPVTVVRARCQAHGSNTPYYPIIDALRRALGLAEEESPAAMADRVAAAITAMDPALGRHVPLYLHLLSIRSAAHRLPDRLEGEELRAALEEAVAALVVVNARQRPLVLHLEDWHWVDEASDAILSSLAGTVAQYPLLVVASYRPDYPARWGNLAHHSHLGLQPLALDHTERMVQSLLGADHCPENLTQVVHDRTEGNPLFIEELCRAFVEGEAVTVRGGRAALSPSWDSLAIPHTVEAVIQARVDRLEPDDREVLRLAAVCGVEFTQKCLERVTPPGTPLARSLRSLKALELIQQVEVLPEAVYRFHHAITQLVVYESVLLAQRKRLHERVAEAIEGLYADRIEEHFDTLAFHYGQSDNPARAIHYMEQAADRAARFYSLVEARKQYRAAVSLVDALADGAGRREKRVDLALKLAAVSFFSPSRELAATLEAALADANALQDRGRVARTIFWMGFTNYALGRFRLALTRFEACRELGETAGNAELTAWAVTYIGRISFFLADFARGIDCLERSIPLLEQTGKSAEVANTMGILLMIHGFRGDFDRVPALEVRIRDIVAGLGNPTTEAMQYICSGLPSLLRGDWAEADGALSSALEISRRAGNPLMEGLALWGMGYGETMRGDAKNGLARMLESIALIESAESCFCLSIFYGMTAEVYAEAGNRSRAKVFAAKALALERGGGDRLGAYAAHRALALSAAAEDPARADAELEQAVELARAQGSQPNLAICRYRAAEVLLRRGEPTAARRALAQATRLFRELGMAWWSRKAAALRKTLPRG